ncbi:hypothetical protein V8F20_010407 [Naviculisporaceae sp. PSN 640]
MKTSMSSIIIGMIVLMGITHVTAQNVMCDDTPHAFTCGEAQITGNDCQDE